MKIAATAMHFLFMWSFNFRMLLVPRPLERAELNVSSDNLI